MASCEDRDPRPPQRLYIDVTVDLVIAQVIQTYIRVRRVHADIAQFAERRQQRSGIIGNARTGRRQR